MNLIFQLLYLSSFVTPMLAPILYRNKRPSMIAFYCNMTTRFSFRKLFIRMLTLYLITFHFYHLSVYGNALCLLPSTVITGLLFFSGFCDKLLHRLHCRRLLVTLFCIGFLALPIPELLPLGFTMIVICIASVFYPSRDLIESMYDFDSRKAFVNGSANEIVSQYFSWPEWENVSGCKSSTIGKTKLIKDRCADVIEDAEVLEFIESEQTE